MEYAFSVENLKATYPEMSALYRRHYGEMQERLLAQGVTLPPYDPQLERYFASNDVGHLIHFVVRLNGEAVGYSNIYLSTDMHNGQLIAVEDTIYLRPDHRNGVGRKFAKAILANLKSRGVIRLQATALTDLRVIPLWKRMGFREVGAVMVYEF